MQETLDKRRVGDRPSMRVQLIELISPPAYQFALLCNFVIIGLQGSVWVLGVSCPLLSRSC
jgi:hypothetical protein